MKLPYPLLNSLFDAQQNFEALEGRDILDETAESFLQLASTGTVAFAMGIATAVFSAATTVTVSGIAPALGRNVAGVVALPNSSDVRLDYASTLGATTFTLRFTSNVGAVSATYHAVWFAVG